VHDPPILGIDHRQEVGLVHACALMQASDVEELLRRRLERFGGRSVEGLRTVLHGNSFRLRTTIPQAPYAPLPRR
jgi:hypothetical protein